MPASPLDHPRPAYPDAAFWHGKRVLVTGHTGFKGAWLTLWLQRMGAEVTGLALPPNTEPSLIRLLGKAASFAQHEGDIRDAATVARVVQRCQPEVVLHLAAQALVRKSYVQPLDTFSTNVQGTANVLDALRGQAGVRVAVVVTTDKVYRNLEHCFPYRETDLLGGHDPYSASKAASELVVSCWRDSFLAAQGVAVASARAGNVIGGGDWSEDRLLPDAARAWSAGLALQIRRPDATRPWQHVLEPLAGYLRLAECLWLNPALASAFNFGPPTHEAATVKAVIEVARRAYGGVDSSHCQVNYDTEAQGPHEAGALALETAKSANVLGVRPRWALDDAVTRTMQWYRMQADGADALGLCERDIEVYLEAA